MMVERVRTKISIVAVLLWMAPAAALAQTATGFDKGYAEIVAQSAFGNVTSQSFGGEVGFTVSPDIQVFAEGGVVRDAAPSSLGAAAQRIAAGISAAAGGGDYRVRQPVRFGLGGVKYVVPTGSKAQPYFLLGAGIANVKRDVSFSTPSGDVANFATIGTDLSGTETKPMVSLGVGVGVPVLERLIIDLQYRYGRVFTSDAGLNVSRAGIGVGVRF